MRVLLVDALPKHLQNDLENHGWRVEAWLSGAEESLEQSIQRFTPEVLVVRSTKIREQELRATPSLSLVIRAGAGVDNIDVTYASSRGIYVANCPGKNAIAVAELTFALLLSIDRYVVQGSHDLHQGVWNKAIYSKGNGISGKKIGLLGFGAIAKEVSRRAQAFGMDVSVCSRSLTPEMATLHGVHFCATPQELSAKVDILSVHLPYTEETKKIVNAELLSLLGPKIFINTSRAELVDEEALWSALEGGLTAGLDVFDGEPRTGQGLFESKIAKHPRVIGTPHIGASTQQAQNAVAEEVFSLALEFSKKGICRNVVNLRSPQPNRNVLVIRHDDRVGVLAQIFQCFRERSLNVQEMENHIFAEEDAAVARIHISGEIDRSVMDAIAAIPEVIYVSKYEIGVLSDTNS